RLAVDGVGAAEARRDGRDLVVHVPRRESVDDRGAVVEQRHRSITLEPFVGLHAPVHGVAVLDLGVLDLVAEHSALLVDERDVVVDPGQSSTPTFLVGPVRSHWPPILMTWSAIAGMTSAVSSTTATAAVTHPLIRISSSLSVVLRA